MWILFAILSAVFASLMTVFMKAALNDIDAMLGTVLRTSIIFILGWFYLFFNKSYQLIPKLSVKNWRALIIAGIITFLTWSCFFIALKSSDNISKVLAIDRLSIILTVILSAIFLKEVITLKIIIGIIVMIIGGLLVIF